mgnify:CR=1 FL=1
MEKKKTYIILGIITLIIVVFGVTFAWVTWRSADNTNINLTVNGLDIKSTDIDITGNNIMPVLDKENGIVEEFTVKQNGNNGDAPICADFTLTLTLLPDGLKDPSFKYDIYNGSTLVGRGSFENYNQGDVITIASGQSITTTESKYKIYVYLDGNMDNPITVTKQTFLFHLKITASQQGGACTPSEVINVSAPVLAEGMIPIKWNGSNWVKANSTNSNNDWYDYVNKKWANAVMVNASSRDNYMTADEGTTIKEDDVLAYYVWIPRYKYQLFNVNSEKMDPILIDVQFESKTTAKSAGSSNGEYLTHPAFTFGTTELDGIWVGKFETSGTADNPTIKAGLDSLVSQNVSTQFATSQKFASGTTYLTQTGVSKVDAHMMKNTEWGAVAYLKQSKYGLGTTDIGNNAYYSYSSGFKAGCGPASETDLTSYTTTCTSYTSTAGVKSSTTGNIYGVYDMAGGAPEDVMGVVQDNTNTSAPISGNDTSSNSGFTGKVYDGGNYTSYTGTAFPSSKYYDLYAFGTTYDDSSAYARRILGDATSETRGWYTDYMVFAYDGAPWFGRGGRADLGSEAGVFCADRGFGSAVWSISFRSVLALGA